MEILPGEITDPGWAGPRCMTCGRPLSHGDQFRICEDVPQAHFDMEMVKPEQRQAFYVERVWSNALQVHGDKGAGLLAAIEWMLTGGGGTRPIDLLKSGEGQRALEMQYEQWPNLERQATAMRKMAGLQ